MLSAMQFRFLSLPGELRNEVYKHYVNSTLASTNYVVHIEPSRTSAKIAAMPVEDKWAIITPRIVRRLQQQDLMHLASTGKLVRRELLTHMFRAHTVEISSLDATDGFWWINVQLLSRITHLSIKCYSVSKSSYVLPIIDVGLLPSLRRLTLNRLSSAFEETKWYVSRYPAENAIEQLRKWFPFQLSRRIVGLKLEVIFGYCGYCRSGCPRDDCIMTKNVTEDLCERAIVDLTIGGTPPWDL